jgi:hypothetical protein
VPEPEPPDEEEPEPPHEHEPDEPSPTPMPMPGMDNMPYINLNAIPTGGEGSSRMQIAATSERPGGSDTGDFRTVCGFSHMNFDDPIVYTGQVGASHLHMFFGNTGANAHSTTESLRGSGNSTCRGGIANRTAYWAPALIDANGTPQAPEDIDIYYKTGYSVASEKIQPFPAGLRMLAGDPKATSGQAHAWWTCDGLMPHYASIPNCSPGSRVMMHVQFPQCWDGKNLDSADHRSHMAYPGGSGCPSSHPVAIPVITYNIPYRVPSSGTSGCRLASDMYDPSLPGGMSAHADWFAAWEPDVVEAFVRNCNNKSVDCHSHLLGDGRMIY